MRERDLLYFELYAYRLIVCSCDSLSVAFHHLHFASNLCDLGLCVGFWIEWKIGIRCAVKYGLFFFPAWILENYPCHCYCHCHFVFCLCAFLRPAIRLVEMPPKAYHIWLETNIFGDFSKKIIWNLVNRTAFNIFNLKCTKVCHKWGFDFLKASRKEEDDRSRLICRRKKSCVRGPSQFVGSKFSKQNGTRHRFLDYNTTCVYSRNITVIANICV